MTEETLPTLADPVADAEAKKWLQGNYDEETKREIRELILNNPKEAIDAFYANLKFGTGGMRGLMGPGSNRMNIYTIQKATQGVANYLKKTLGEGEDLSVFIGYDSRKNSRQFAEEAAKVLAGNGIRAFLTSDIRPTPLVSFGCRYKKCAAALMITASHNPKDYNGYKVYWSDGGQVLPPHDKGIVQEANAIQDLSSIQIAESIDDPLIETVEDDVDDAYLNGLKNLSLYPNLAKESSIPLKITYTSLHGTGITLAPRALRLMGFFHLNFVDPQVIPDGNFPTAPYPNPEEEAALSLGIQKMLESDSDLLIATDPDADRMGVVVNHHGKPVILTGNQIACILLSHILEGYALHQSLPENPAAIKSVVTTELFRAIAEGHQVKVFEVLPGFKYIAEKIRNWEADHAHHFIFGAEESYGYLFGTEARDKDAIGASVWIAEAALKAKEEGKTLLEVLDALFEKHGIYQEELISAQFPESKEGKEAMQQAMQKLRQSPLQEINGDPIVRMDDYLNKGDLPPSDFLIYHFADGSRLMVRPSGTEPKIKVYCGIVENTFDSLEEGLKKAHDRADAYLREVLRILQ
jgi:phosphomannomutase